MELFVLPHIPGETTSSLPSRLHRRSRFHGFPCCKKGYLPVAGATFALAAARRGRFSKAVVRRVDPDPVAFCPPSAYAPEADDLDYWQYPEYDFLNYEAWDMDGYLALLQDASAGGDWQHASSLLEEMRSHGLQPDVPCYSLVLQACRRGGGGSKASEVLEEMWKKELLPTPSCYGDAIAACHEEGREDLVGQLQGSLSSGAWDQRPRRGTTNSMRSQQVFLRWAGLGVGVGPAGTAFPVGAKARDWLGQRGRDDGPLPRNSSAGTDKVRQWTMLAGHPASESLNFVHRLRFCLASL
ncbi:unnamed protein product [Cladocopium goreaui]|uniref:Pentatricopeptide repeat-containing protein GUN1, chloroplastic (Pentatricopeptide repeat-containing protein At2g31400) (Protein GENOMES UNCOUPLED 1) n=1 Tax=Cladocopium goreaui TaxID=2562237 RepID=A0A9P1GQH9_9DINO|nr:unnamed protein product [Cladocopium goreaui]